MSPLTMKAVTSLELALMATCLACAGEATHYSPQRPDVLDVASDRSVAEAHEEPSEAPGRIVGAYYRGDGTGFNLHLTVAADGTFECKWTGCLGGYGNCSGTWAREGNRMTMNTVSADGMFENRPLGDLEVIEGSDAPQLVQLNDREFFDKWGPSRYSCFSRIE